MSCRGLKVDCHISIKDDTRNEEDEVDVNKQGVTNGHQA